MEWFTRKTATLSIRLKPRWDALQSDPCSRVLLAKYEVKV